MTIGDLIAELEMFNPAIEIAIGEDNGSSAILYDIKPELLTNDDNGTPFMVLWMD